MARKTRECETSRKNSAEIKMESYTNRQWRERNISNKKFIIFFIFYYFLFFFLMKMKVLRWQSLFLISCLLRKLKNKKLQNIKLNLCQYRGIIINKKPKKNKIRKYENTSHNLIFVIIFNASKYIKKSVFFLFLFVFILLLWVKMKHRKSLVIFLIASIIIFIIKCRIKAPSLAAS